MYTNALYTIGHSNRSMDELLSLLRANEVTAIADVRSKPYSLRNPQFNLNEIKSALHGSGIRYVFLGEELGARRREPECYEDGQAKYALISKLPLFQSGLARLRTGLQSYRIALLCAEKEPLTCHRMILVCRHLRCDYEIRHILDERPAEPQSDTEFRLLDVVGLYSRDLFRSRDDLLAEAYDIQGSKIAYRKDRQGEFLPNREDN